MTALEPGCPMSPEPPTSPGCLATGSVPPFCSSPQARGSVGPSDHPGYPLGTALGGSVEHLLPCSSIPCQCGQQGHPFGWARMLGCLCLARDSLLGARQQRWLKCRRTGRPGAAEITNTCLF